jgi:hypothetical protein
MLRATGDGWPCGKNGTNFAFPTARQHDPLESLVRDRPSHLPPSAQVDGLHLASAIEVPGKKPMRSKPAEGR